MNVVSTSRARSCGTKVELIDNRDGSFEAFDEYPVSYAIRNEMRWATLCEHGNYVLHSTRALAQSFMAAPEEFCEECREECRA